MKKLFWLLCFTLGFGAVALADDLKEGVEYKTVGPFDTATGDKVEVVEFFWYGCPHCNAFEPFISKWNQSKPDNVEFIRVPAVFHPSWKVHARAYYAMEAMGILEKTHEAVFEAMHKNKIKLNTMEEFADFIASTGASRDEFIKQYQSFSVDGQVRKANKLLKDYDVTGVPFVAINGKYITDGRMAGSYPRLIEIIEQLVAKESAR
jgi:thiol:disulfide interchange protein DsbA